MSVNMCLFLTLEVVFHKWYFSQSLLLFDILLVLFYTTSDKNNIYIIRALTTVDINYLYHYQYIP